MLKKIPFQDSSEILQRFKLSKDAVGLVSPEDAPQDVMVILAKGQHLADYVNFISHALPPREGICWALATQEELGVSDVMNAQGIREQIRSWVVMPEEHKRRALLDLAEELGTEGPTGWLCFAVGWNGSGSMAAPSGPVVLPPLYLHAKALLGAVALIPTTSKEDIKALIETAHNCALEVANGAWLGVAN